MNGRARTGLLAGIIVSFLSVLAGCAGPAGPAPSGSDSASPRPSASAAPSESAEGDGSRFLISCMGVDGGERTFTRLEEAWSDPGYVRIESCTAATAEDEVELTPDEEAVASVAAGDGDTDPLPAYLAVLAACVRIPPDRIAEQPRSLLEGVLLLCPEAPHADLVAADLQSGGRG